MQALMYVLFSAIFSLDFLNIYGFVPRYVTWFPELLSVFTLLIVVLYGVRNKIINLNLGYYAIFALLLLHLVFGIVLNTVPTGSLITGIRDYFKYIPFFLLPVVYSVSSRDIRNQLMYLLILALLQLPVSAYQLFIESAGLNTADLVGGTVGTSGHLSIFLVCASAVWLAFYFRSGNKRPLLFWSVLVLILAPTTMNLSKGTLFLIPMAMLVPAILDNKGGGRIKRLAGSIIVLMVFSTSFIMIYNAVYDRQHNKASEYDLLAFFTTKGKMQEYLIKSESADEKEKGGKIGGLIIVNKELSQDPVAHFFGLGMGNVSRSFLGEQYSGEYVDKYKGLGGATAGSLIWEIGWFGTFLVFVLCFWILRDAIYVKSLRGVRGALALGWAAVLVVLMVAFFYKNIIHTNVLGYLFWYYSGYIAALSARMKAVHLKQRFGEKAWSDSEYAYEKAGIPIDHQGVAGRNAQ